MGMLGFFIFCGWCSGVVNGMSIFSLLVSCCYLLMGMCFFSFVGAVVC
jgi:hypothetical protein